MNAEGAPGRIPNRTLVAALLLCGVYTLLAVLEMSRVGPTVDEPTYFNSGRVILNEGWSHPLTRLHGPLPYYLNQILVGGFPSSGYEPQADHDGLLLRGRLGLLPFGWIAAAIVFLWSRRLFGDRGALLSLTLFSLNPLMIGYSGLLAVDIVHTGAVLLVLYATWRFLQRPDLLRAAGLGVLLGIAFATKYLALLNGPFVVVAAAWGLWRGRPGTQDRGVRRAGTALSGALIVSVTSVVTLHACYGFGPGFAPLEAEAYQSAFLQRLFSMPLADTLLASFPRPFLLGVDYQMWVGEGAHFTPYLNGRFASGHADYYLWVFLRKSPEILILFALWIGLRWLPCWLFGNATRGLRSSAWVLFPPALLAVLYLSLFTALQIGVRYVLPLFPMLFIACGVLANERWIRRGGQRMALAGWGLVIALHAWDLGAQWPNLIGYINRASGGQAQGYRYFNDSNSDWGQLVRSGRALLEETEAEPFLVLTPLMGPRFGRVAVELRYLVRRDPEAPDRLRHWVLALEPVRNVGAAWWLFDASAQSWERALEETPDERARCDLVVAYLGDGRPERAREHLARIGQPRSRALRELADVLARNEAQATAELQLRLIALWTQVGRHDKVLELLEAADGLLARHPRRNLLRAPALMKQGRIEAAVGVLEGEDFESRPRAALMLARYYFVQERFGEARDLLERHLEQLDPSLAEGAAALLEEIRKQEQRFGSFRKALSGGSR